MKFDAAIPTALTTASTLAVTTKDAVLYGVTIMAGATATAGSVVCRVANSTGTPVYALSVVTSGGNISDGPMAPIVCAGGISAVCTGTAFNYVVLYANL
jgi:hypothetical protein